MTGGAFRWWLSLQQGGVPAGEIIIPSCPSASTTDQNGDVSRFHVTVCLCNYPPIRGLIGETPSNDDVTLTVNGSSVGWTLSNGTAHDLCMTWDVNQPLSYGDTISITFDVGWTNPADGPTYNVTNTIPAPVQLRTIPRFDAITGRLIQGSWYNIRTDDNSTFINSDGYVEGVSNSKLIYTGARVVQNLFNVTTDLAAGSNATLTEVTGTISPPPNVPDGTRVWRWVSPDSAAAELRIGPYAAFPTAGMHGNTSLWVKNNASTGQYRIQYYSAGGSNTSNALTPGAEWERVSLNGVNSYAKTPYLIREVGSGTRDLYLCAIQHQDKTARSDPTIPDEYESVGVGGSTGYGIYNRANGNTVDVNGVVTDTPGAVLATAPVLRHAPAATNQISESSPSTTYWTKRGATTIATVSEGHALGKTTQVRSLGAAGVNDFYLSMVGGTFSNSIRIEPSCLIKAVSTSGSVRIQNVQGPTYGQWTIDLSLLSTSAFGYLTRNHAAVTVNTEFTSTATGAAGLQYYAVSGSLNFDLLGVQLETGSVSTPSIKTTTAPASRTIDQILHPNVLDQAQGSIVLRVKLKPGTYTPTADRGLVTIDTAVNNMLYLNSGDSISVESFDSTNTVNSGVVVQSADDELGIYLSYADSTEYPASGNISVGLKNLTTGSAWAESTGNYDGSYPNTGGLVRLLSGLTCEAEIADFVGYNVHQTPAVLKSFFLAEIPDGALVDTTTGDHLADTATADYLIETI